MRKRWGTLALAIGILAMLLSTWFFRLNLSPSVPLGVYGLYALSPLIGRGTFVVLPVPASVQAFHSRWIPLLKPVAAVAGDIVCVWNGALWAWDQTPGGTPVDYGIIWHIYKGTAIPRIEGCMQVEEGTVFLASTALDSLDSRYFGAVPITTLTAQASPLLTWGGTSPSPAPLLMPSWLTRSPEWNANMRPTACVPVPPN